MYVCICHGLTESALRQAIRGHGLPSVEQVRDRTGATGCCGSCSEEVAFILHEERLSLADPALAGCSAQAVA